jgi:hypothetical protein
MGGIGLTGALLCGCAGRTAVAANPAPSGSASGGGPQATASKDVAAMLAAFRSPPGAQSLSGRPSDAPALILQSTGALDDSDVARHTAWWFVPGPSGQALQWIRAHAPARISGSGRAGDRKSGATVDELAFDFGPESLIRSRTLDVRVASYHGGALIRLDADAAWQPVRPAAARVPAGTTRLIVRGYSPISAPGTRQKVTTLATVSDPRLIARVRAAVDALPLQPPGGYNCPMDNGGKLVLEFYSTGAAQPGAVVGALGTGCQTVDLSVRGGPPSTVLAGAGGAGGFAQQVVTILGLTFSTRS